MIEFSPTHTLFLLTNHKPQIQDNDYAFWNRVVMIPFTISFVDEPTQPFERKRDRQLMSKLLEEKSGILAWMVRGCLSWKQEGLNPPEIVKAATQEYEHEEDIIGRFIEECCIKKDDGVISADSLFQTYKNWCEENNFEAVSQTSFGRKMTSYARKSSKNGRRFYSGLILNKE